jgi:hypothetical protein
LKESLDLFWSPVQNWRRIPNSLKKGDGLFNKKLEGGQLIEGADAERSK